MKKLQARYTDKLDAAQKGVARFTEALAETVNPAYDFEWSDKHFMDAAEVAVYGEILAYLEKETATLEILKESVLDRILTAAKYPEESTSSGSNKIGRYKLAVFANVYSELSYI